MQTIYKYPIKITNLQRVELPEGAQILSAQEQNGIIFLWALVDSEANKVLRNFEVVGTGMPITLIGERKYINSVQMHGKLVWHIFELL